MNDICTEVTTDKIDFLESIKIDIDENKAYFNTNLNYDRLPNCSLERNILTILGLTIGKITEVSVEEYWEYAEELIDHEINRYSSYKKAIESLRKGTSNDYS